MKKVVRGMKPASRRIIELYKAGMSKQDIGVELGKSYESVYQVLKLYGIIQTQKKCTDKEIVEMIKDGKSQVQIAEKLRCGTKRIRRLQIANGYQTRNIHETYGNEIAPIPDIPEKEVKTEIIAVNGKRYKDVTGYIVDIG